MAYVRVINLDQAVLDKMRANIYELDFSLTKTSRGYHLKIVSKGEPLFDQDLLTSSRRYATEDLMEALDGVFGEPILLDLVARLRHYGEASTDIYLPPSSGGT